jgi:hypothetical protein
VLRTTILGKVKFKIFYLILLCSISCKIDEPEIVVNEPIDDDIEVPDEDRSPSNAFQDSVIEQHELAILFLGIDPRYLWSPDSGLFVVGTNGKANWNGVVANYYQDWEFVSSATLVLDDSIVFSDSVGFRLKGNSSRAKPNKSFGLYWRSEYGNKNFKSDELFSGGSGKYKRLYFRNGGNDPDSLHFKGSVITSLLEDETHVEYAKYRPAVVYINKEYWGLYDMREIITPHYFKYKYGVEDDQVNILRWNPRRPGIDDGLRDHWISEVYEYINANDVSDPHIYQEIQSRINLQSLIDYYILETYIYNWDWPLNNSSWWNSTESIDHIKYTWIAHDLDWSFRRFTSEYLWLGNYYRNTDYYRQEYSAGFFLLNRLLENQEFKKSFFSRYLYFVDHIFTSDKIMMHVHQMIDETENEYRWHHQRWPESSISAVEWKEKWKNFVDFGAERNEWIRPVIEGWLNEIE